MKFGFITLAAIASVSALASIASADVLLGGFEGSLASPLADANWALRNNVNSLNSGAAAANFGYFATGSTEGSTAMRIRIPGGFTWGLELTQGGAGGDSFRTAWNANDALRFDVTIDGGSPGVNPYQVFLASVQGENQPWTQASSNLTAVSGSGENAVGAGTVTMQWNYRAAGALFSSPTGAWAQLNIATNGGNFDIAPYGFFDNVRLVTVPEPTTLTVLASAGTLVLRRRR